MAIVKENSYGEKNPLFLRFVNRKISTVDVLQSFSQSKDPITAGAAVKALENPPDLEDFRKELEEAVRDLVKEGLGEEFKVFVNHYMEPSIVQVTDTEKTPFGENRMHSACIKDVDSTWIEGFICYNLCLYIKAFGLDNLKSCRTCGTLFCHKGKWAVYCEDICNPKKSKK
jgi:hypothetical protein